MSSPTQELVEEFLAGRKARGLADGTVRYYAYSLRLLSEFAQRRNLTHWRQFKAEHVEAFLFELVNEDIALNSRQKHTCNVRVFFKWLEDSGKILRDPSLHIPLPNTDADERPLLEPPLSEEQIIEMFQRLPRASVIDLRNLLTLDLYYSAGLRRAEALSLDVQDIDLRRRELHVRRGKGSKPRTVPIMTGLYHALQNYLALRRALVKGPDAGALLLARMGRRLRRSNIDALFRDLNKRELVSGRHLHPHLLRHSIAVHLLRGGTDIRYIASFLGHHSIESTKIYLRLVPSDLKAAYDDAMPRFKVAT